MRRKDRTVKKLEAIRHWQLLEPDQEIMTHFTPIAADARGSMSGACGIRISGNPEFIDAVLSRLKDLLAAESEVTRLAISRRSVKTSSVKNGDSGVGQKSNNADRDAEICYIQIWERAMKTMKTRHHGDVKRRIAP